MFRNVNVEGYRIMRNISIGVTSSSADKMKSYEEAVRALNSLQSNAATLEKTRQERDKYQYRKITETVEMAARANVTLDDIDKLSVIHVSGTKGKGSTCAFTESILRNCGFRTGFFSSPHLVEVRERIRINGTPLSKQMFSDYFWDCFKKLEETKEAHNGEMPPYFKFLTIMAFHVFLKEKVDVAIMEVGIGGQYDCTNIIRHPVVCGVSSLGIDHQSILGDTIDKIAWQKAGIFKPGVPAVTIPQPEEALEVMMRRAVERQCPLYVIDRYDKYGSTDGLTLGIAGEMQKLNAALAVELCRIFIQNCGLGIKARQQFYTQYMESDRAATVEALRGFPLSQYFVKGLSDCKWAGRTQVLKRPKATYYIDGAHTVSSTEQCIEWFSVAAHKEEQQIGDNVARVLMFNCTGDRKPETLLQYFLDCDFDVAVFCPNISSCDGSRADQDNLMVTKTFQNQRCIECKQAWEQLMTSRSRHACTSPVDDSHAESRADCQVKTLHTSCHDNDELQARQRKVSIGSDLSDLDSGVGSEFGSKSNPASCTSSLRSTPVSDSVHGFVFPCITDTLQWINQGSDPELVSPVDIDSRPVPLVLKNAKHIQVLCTGSLHLVGGVLGVLDPDLNSHTPET